VDMTASILVSVVPSFGSCQHLLAMTQLSQTTRLLSTMGFPPKIFSALTRAGFESLDDMIGMSEAELLEGEHRTALQEGCVAEGFHV